jgi:hypothetical protein
MRRSRLGPARFVTILTLGLLGGGLLGGCTADQEPAAPDPAAATPPTPTASALPPAAPLPLPEPVPPGGPVPPEPGLGPEDRALLAQARREGAPWVVLLVATAPDRTATAETGLEELGGVIGTGPGDGVLRLTMPTQHVEQAAEVPGVTAVDVEQVVPPAAGHNR